METCGSENKKGKRRRKIGKTGKDKDNNQKKCREGGEGEGKMNKQQYHLEHVWYECMLYPHAALTSVRILKDL